MFDNLFILFSILYEYSLYCILLIAWYLISLTDRLHLRIRMNIYGKKCSKYLDKIILNPKVKYYFKHMYIRNICIFLDIIAGFLEGIDNNNIIIKLDEQSNKNKDIVLNENTQNTMNIFNKLENDNRDNSNNFSQEDSQESSQKKSQESSQKKSQESSQESSQKKSQESSQESSQKELNINNTNLKIQKPIRRTIIRIKNKNNK